jgi:hypothetical protein
MTLMSFILWLSCAPVPVICYGLVPEFSFGASITFSAFVYRYSANLLLLWGEIPRPNKLARIIGSLLMKPCPERAFGGLPHPGSTKLPGFHLGGDCHIFWKSLRKMYEEEEGV